jgi:endoglucanase
MQHTHRLARLFPATLLLMSTFGCASPPSRNVLEDSTPPTNLSPNPPGSPVAVHGQLQVSGNTLLDASGNPVQLRGLSSMWLSWENRPFGEKKSSLEFMRDSWKVSVVRAAMGTEQSGGYLAGGQAAMLDKVETIVKNAISTGVYVLVDWHTERAVDQQEEAIAFFTAMAKKYGGFPNVIWEPYNEPNGFTWDEIKPYHEAIVDAIRPHDPDNIIVMGTPHWSQDVDIASLDPVSPASGATNLMYTLHFYSCTHKQPFRDKATTALGNGIALFVTEFGATPADGGTPPNSNMVCRDETNAWFDFMAQNNISGVAWKFDQCQDASCILGPGSATNGPWPDSMLTTDVGATEKSPGVTQGGGHGQLIVDWLRQ